MEALYDDGRPEGAIGPHTEPMSPTLPPPPRHSMSFMGRLGTVLLTFSGRTTLHGVNHTAQSQKARSRCFWFTIVFSASLGFSVNLFYLIEKYVQIPVLTNVQHDSEDFSFPDISFCNLNPIYFPPDGTHGFRQLTNDITSFYNRRNLGNTTSAFLNSLSDYLYVRRRPYSQPPWSFILQCIYQGDSRCSWEHFQVQTIWPYGNCFTFNATKLNKTREVIKELTYRGFRPNFQVILYKALEYPLGFRHDPHNTLDMPSGVILMIHEPGSFPHISESYLLDTCTIIDLKITQKLHMSKLNKCQAQRRYYSYADGVTNRNSTYLGRWADCVYHTLQANVYKNCRCLMEIYPIPIELKHASFCKDPGLNMSLGHLQFCLNATFNTLPTNTLGECYRDFCQHSSYTTVISHARFPAVIERNSHQEWLAKLAQLERREISVYGKSVLSKKALLPGANMSLMQAAMANRRDLLDVEFVDRNFMMLRVVPSSLFMDRVEETEEYPLSRLMSDIGGCMGLWVGASLITLCEVLDFCFDVFDAITLHRQNRRSKSASLRRANRSEQQQYFMPVSANGAQSIPGGVAATTFYTLNSSRGGDRGLMGDYLQPGGRFVFDIPEEVLGLSNDNFNFNYNSPSGIANTGDCYRQPHQSTSNSRARKKRIPTGEAISKPLSTSTSADNRDVLVSEASSSLNDTQSQVDWITTV